MTSSYFFHFLLFKLFWFHGLKWAALSLFKLHDWYSLLAGNSVDIFSPIENISIFSEKCLLTFHTMFLFFSLCVYYDTYHCIRLKWLWHNFVLLVISNIRLLTCWIVNYRDIHYGNNYLYGIVIIYIIIGYSFKFLI